MTKKIFAIAKAIQPNISFFFSRLYKCVKDAMPKAIKTAIWILKITLPVSLAVSILNYYGLIQLVTQHLTPAFNLIGLRGEAALPFVTGILLNIYSVIAVLSQLSLDLREITIIAVMSLIAHNLIIETTIQSKTGSKAWHMVALRVGAAFGAAAILNLLLPDMSQKVSLLSNTHTASSISELLYGWVFSSFRLILKIIILVSLLMILQKILQEFKLIELLTKPLSPMLKFMGLPESTTFLWIVANSLGLAYGSAVMMEEVKEGRITKKDADLLNYHVAISHSNLEDLLLFAAIGVSILWMMIPRLIIAIAVVWGRRFFVNRE
ncbi:MAG TPA: nucleoside recognition domain-containing protein [Tenuifilaceae bacterium]|nr:nucleoside recognition domain-containing protein [Tenuifilaceae bacterium]HPI45204.1 nucleoside recognition domain-containing protein [Tenuifilaceae bacterium]HPN23207.1 nucleoside recognition domain-containing protein [Tenuifilaceae bacterium]